MLSRIPSNVTGRCVRLFLALLASASAAVIASGAIGSSEDGCVTTGLDDLSERGRDSARGRTVQTDCPEPARTLVWAGIVGLGVECLSGEPWQSQCYDSSDGHNASSWVASNAFGQWTARSAHAYYLGSTQSTLPVRSITVDGGRSDQEECELSGNHWNGDYCEIVEQDPGTSPIIIATESSSYHLTSASDGVLFDIDGDGTDEQVAWTQPAASVAFLAIDRDGDGAITSGKELFGDVTIPGESNGFCALSRMTVDSNGGAVRGSVSEDDPIFTRLLLWTDRNHNGVSEPAELLPASNLLSDIGLGYQLHNRRDGHGNLYRFRGWVHFRTSPGRNRALSPEEDQGRRRQIYDVYLSTLR
jgi:hypothetical protein